MRNDFINEMEEDEWSPLHEAGEVTDE